MAAKLHNVAAINGFATTLNGTITNSDVSITLTSVVDLPTDGGILVIDRVDASGTLTPSTREYISYTGITSSTLTGCTRGLASSTAQSHGSGAIVEEVWSVTHVKDLISFLEVAHADDGSIAASVTLATPTLTSPVLNTGLSGTAFLDEDDMASDSATKVASQQSIKSYVGEQTVVASDATPDPTGDRKKNELYVTALATAATISAPSGTPANGNTLIIRIKDDGTARAISYNAIYDGLYDDLPSSTTANKTLYIGFIYNSASSKWEMLATTEEA